MSILSFIIFVVVAGVVLYLVNLIPMDGTLKQVIKVIVIAAIIILAILLFVPLLLHLGSGIHLR
jgi:hypothetical protein